MEFLKDPIVNSGAWLGRLLAGTGLSEVWVRAIMMVIGSLALALVPLVAIIFLIWTERKIVARMQGRLGPNDSGPYPGPWALFQTLADAIKLLTKEDIIPAAADRRVFNAAPPMIVAIAVLIWAAIPLGKGLIGSDLSIGIFYIVSVGSGGMVVLLMAGWGANNKYAMLGALRAIAQLVSYKIPQVLAVLVVVMIAGSFSMQEIIEAQNVPFLFVMPVTALIFFIASLAEVARLPFDLVEADSEIASGYFIEYSGMKFGQFYLAEFMNSFALSVITAAVFLAGWRGPLVGSVPILGTLWLLGKAFVVFFVLMWLRATMPRLRIDQMLDFSWKFLVPLALANICVVAVVDTVVPLDSHFTARMGALFAANVLLATVVLGMLAVAGRKAQQSAVSS